MKHAQQTEPASFTAEDDTPVVFKLIRGRWIEQAPDGVDHDQPVRIRFDGIPSLPGGRRLI